MNDTLKNVGKRLYDIYFAIGAIAMGLLALLVAFTVIARYFFAHSWKELAEFITTLFAFTTFWGMGLCLLRNDHVIIDIVYDRIKPSVKRWVAVVDYLIVFIVVAVFTYFGFKYVAAAGKQISQGMGIPMKYMYGIMPVSGVICGICTIIKIAGFITADISEFAPVYYKKDRDGEGGESR